MLQPVVGDATHFNPRTREGCDLSAPSVHCRRSRFQSTHPRGVRLQLAGAILMTLSHFNPRTREGCDDASPFSASALLDFNPRTREGCDPIHRYVAASLGHFNPRTREGCDRCGRSMLSSSTRFQSTHPRGVRLNSKDFGVPQTRISIHAPARGATLDNWLLPRVTRYFNPRTREGCDGYF